MTGWQATVAVLAVAAVAAGYLAWRWRSDLLAARYDLTRAEQAVEAAEMRALQAEVAVADLQTELTDCRHRLDINRAVRSQMAERILELRQTARQLRFELKNANTLNRRDTERDLLAAILATPVPPEVVDAERANERAARGDTHG